MHGVKQVIGAAFLVMTAAGCVGQADMTSSSDRMGALEQRVPALDQKQAATQAAADRAAQAAAKAEQAFRKSAAEVARPPLRRGDCHSSAVGSRPPACWTPRPRYRSPWSRCGRHRGGEPHIKALAVRQGAEVGL
jgi:outer membrane murein-binding lipoprotein Lpp